MARKRRFGKRGRKRWRGGYWGAMSRGEITVDENGYPKAVQDLDSDDEEIPTVTAPKPRVRKKPQTSSLDAILNPSRKYRLKEMQ